ncbi:polymeric immunoglobulin receptor-like [Neoarius graeffei]|uniref:polymeric immunoglobulin receptor-like n=1 Tax=Neoarius graeffei TaxID=443677 RepID=UPI00298D163D|nr:polymeric immunoglobulin receptor-like [Neoarius graeffei]
MGCFFFFILIISSVASQDYRHFSVKTGGSVTIPCHYDRKYIQHKKYWCSGTTLNFCTIEAYTNETRGKVTVTDHPAERLFTVTLNNLQTENTGWYWCAVEISGGPDVKEYLYITYLCSDPDLSVMKSSVSAEEGGSVTVHCLYSAAYQKKQKQWCRFKDRQCITLGKTGKPKTSTVQLRDDERRRNFSVQMNGLNKSDAGWYWCRAGDLQVPVHINVTDPPPVLTTTVMAASHQATTHEGGRSVSKYSPASTCEETTKPGHFCIANN